MPQPDLKSCPFCGSSDIVKDTSGESMRFQCNDCGAITDSWFKGPGAEIGAANAWNRRAALAQQGGVKVPPVVTTDSAPLKYGEYGKSVWVDCWNSCVAETLRLNAARPADQDAVDAAYIAGALAMREKVARALEVSPRKVIYELAEHVRNKIKPPSVDECRQWDRPALAQPEHK